jgi:hypothetical protein
MNARMSGTSAVAGALLVFLAGYAGAGTGTGQSAGPTGRGGADPLVQPGYGTLAQAAFTLELESGELQIQITPLAESVIRPLIGDHWYHVPALGVTLDRRPNKQ